MDGIDYNNLLSSLNKLSEAQDEVREAQKNDFVEVLEKLGQNDAANRVKEKGLPSTIVVSHDLYPVCKKTMNAYAEVIQDKYTDQTNLIMLLWNNINEPLLVKLK